MALWLSALTAVAGSAPYLAVLGPAPLRWQALRPARPPGLLSLPPLVMTNAEDRLGDTSDIATLPLPSTRPPPGNAAAADRLPGNADLPGETDPFGTNPFQEEPAPVNPVVPWEALMPYVTAPAGTNHALSFPLPLYFTPPLIPMPRSSSATYSTSP